MDGVVVIGEGEKDEAPMLFNGERIGDGTPPQVDIAVDPIDGTRPTALGRGGALAVIALAEQRCDVRPGAVRLHGEARRRHPRPRAPSTHPADAAENLHDDRQGQAHASVRDLTAIVLDRPRHEELIDEIRSAGARIRLITDGDVAGAIATCLARHRARTSCSAIGGTPEGVIAAAALKAMGGEIQGRLWPPRRRASGRGARRGLRPRRRAHDRRPRARRQLLLRRHRDHRRRAASGVRYDEVGADAQSLVMRSKSGTVRLIDARHPLHKLSEYSAIEFG